MARQLDNLSAWRRKMNARLGKLLLVVGLLAGVFFLLPKSACCGATDLEMEQLTDRATAGDLVAVRSLYERAKSDGVEPMMEHWAFEGALLGDRQLREAFVEMFSARFDDQRKAHAIAQAQSRASLPGASCLKEVLSGDPGESVCNR
jgi:hypothetical protein